MFNSQLAQKLVALLHTDEMTRDAPIGVIERNGVVTLRGTAPTDQVKARAEGVIREQDGVVTVINEIQIDEPEPAAPAMEVMPPAHPGSPH